jgi:HEAT repeat protein
MTPLKKTPTLDDEEIRGLSSPDTWCEVAKALAAAGEHRAIVPLLNAYESPIEGGKRCLLEALEELDAGGAAAGLFETNDARQRVQALRLVELFGSDRHLSLLARALSDPADGVRAQARRALVNQEWTGPWEAAMISLLGDNDPQTQEMAVDSLRRRNSAASTAALRAHGFAGA